MIDEQQGFNKPLPERPLDPEDPRVRSLEGPFQDPTLYEQIKEADSALDKESLAWQKILKLDERAILDFLIDKIYGNIALEAAFRNYLFHPVPKELQNFLQNLLLESIIEYAESQS